MKNFSDTQINSVKNTISSWYSLVIPESIIEQVLKNEYNNIGEFSETFGLDTLQRSMFMRGVLTYIGIESSWPIYADSDQYAMEFYTLLGKKCREFGITVTFDDTNS